MFLNIIQYSASLLLTWYILKKECRIVWRCVLMKCHEISSLSLYLMFSNIDWYCLKETYRERSTMYYVLFYWN